jgi:two-component system sensor histidine kinase KdpD
MKTLKQKTGLSIEKQYFFSTIILFFFIAVLYLIQDTIGYETVSIILLLIIFLLPLFNFSRGPIILSAIISALAWDYYFIPPHFTMHIAKTEDVVMLFMFFIVAVTNGVLTSKLYVQKNRMLNQERKSDALYNLLKELASANNRDELLAKFSIEISEVFGLETIIYFPENGDKLNRVPDRASTFVPDEMEWLAAQASFKEKSEGGRTTNIVSGAEGLYLPQTDSSGNIVCVIGVHLNENMKTDSEELKFLKTYIKEISPFLKKF